MVSNGSEPLARPFTQSWTQIASRGKRLLILCFITWRFVGRQCRGIPVHSGRRGWGIHLTTAPSLQGISKVSFAISCLYCQKQHIHHDALSKRRAYPRASSWSEIILAVKRSLARCSRWSPRPRWKVALTHPWIVHSPCQGKKWTRPKFPCRRARWPGLSCPVTSLSLRALQQARLQLLTQAALRAAFLFAALLFPPQPWRSQSCETRTR